MAPRGSEEFDIIYRACSGIKRRVDAGVPAHNQSASWAKKFGPLAPILLLLWKFKVAILLVLSKGKLLLFGLSKFSTFGSML